MKQVSVWAARNKWPARILIVVSYFILNGIGLFLGDALQVSHFIIPSAWIYLTGFLFIAACLLYPSKKNKNHYTNFYKRQKSADLFLVSISFLLVVGFGNHYNLQRAQTPFSFTNAVAAALTVSTSNAETSIEPTPKKKTSFIKQWKKRLKENIRTIRREYKDATPGERTALVILSVIIALGLLLLVAGLSCNLSCSGSDGAAILVALLGTTLIVFLFVRVIKRINRGKRKPQPKVGTTT